MLVGIVLTTGRLNGAGQKTNPKIKHTFHAFHLPFSVGLTLKSPHMQPRILVLELLRLRTFVE